MPILVIGILLCIGLLYFGYKAFTAPERKEDPLTSKKQELKDLDVEDKVLDVEDQIIKRHKDLDKKRKRILK